ncbi:hypothetical protein PLICRDRAFT_146294 [Plicaturopsis crispa FD-325 SS-3]|uniref:Unplaced genomic scaffold PLICRscaffold_16, whole genome shotgun sequence n=1 Tax=Plicaturopsis crispa FD-325 SS-3 TaxID=944288 RepID=A0A0C9SL34_PLICR|nr:hypothetical protein PLICRDRAFT_146294 [Plicaturopsis crispa FD-325 SS-3]
MTYNLRVPYTGSSLQLIVSIDIGTTFTAASYCMLQPGVVPKFEELQRWHMQATSDAKVPSVIYYDRIGKPCAFAAETQDDEMRHRAEIEDWCEASWWKLHLRPDHLPMISNLDLPPLPPRKTVEDVFVDYLGYVKQEIKKFIEDSYGDGHAIWKTLYPHMAVILTTPNGWEGRQQTRMREAAVRAELVDASGKQRIKFVTEAEAAVLYAADSGSINNWLVEGERIILCDCGGGTLDITGYRIEGLNPLRLAESAPSQCYLAGAVFVNRAAEVYMRDVLAGSHWDVPEILTAAVRHFEANAKKKFDDASLSSLVFLGGYKNDESLGISRGRLRIPGAAIASFFEPSIRSIKDGLEEVVFGNGGNQAKRVILVGGLASSPWVHSQLVLWGKQRGIAVSRPDGPTIKAVANGALAWYIDQTVSTRYSRWHYGINIRTPYQPHSLAHRAYVPWYGLNGIKYIGDGWGSIVYKNNRIRAGRAFMQPFSVEMAESRSNWTHSVDIYVYRGAPPPPDLLTDPSRGFDIRPGFDVICTISGNLKKCYLASEVKVSPLTGENYRNVAFDICILLGEPEITARLHWLENGRDVYGPAIVTYD